MFYNIFFYTFTPILFRNNNLQNQTIMLLEKIGNNAGLVWAALEGGELNVKAVKKATKLTEKDLNLAFGWLAREGKVTFSEVEGELFVALA